MSHISTVLAIFVVFALIAICAISMALSLLSSERERAQLEQPAVDGEDVKKPA
jgi:hypothetical protein